MTINCIACLDGWDWALLGTSSVRFLKARLSDTLPCRLSSLPALHAVALALPCMFRRGIPLCSLSCQKQSMLDRHTHTTLRANALTLIRSWVLQVLDRSPCALAALVLAPRDLQCCSRYRTMLYVSPGVGGRGIPYYTVDSEMTLPMTPSLHPFNQVHWATIKAHTTYHKSEN